MKLLLTILAGALLAACGGNVATVAPLRYDFGSLSGGNPGSRLPVAAGDVQAVPALSGPAMHYRLAYAEPLRRLTYAESRWAAPPAELLQAFLERRFFVFPEADASGNGCRLELVVDEFEQRFDDPRQSRAILEVRAALTPMHRGEILSRKGFLISKPAPSPDARGGVAGARDAVHALADDLDGWLGELARVQPGLVKRCRS
jgi:cholesterol transport system auxiliary component